VIFPAALFNAGRPVLLVPEGYAADAAPKRIVVAWSGAREATRAVHDALPLLKQAEMVRIVTVVGSSGQGEEDPGADIARHLARHDVTVDVKQVPGGGNTAARLVMDEARYFGADLVVMGGYGHSRLSEWIMGGVTRDVLADLQLPVLFSH
jgi:nucleotide-binding universal stress UspA family protein